MLIKMTKFHDLTSHSPSYYIIRSSHLVVDIPFPLVVGARSILIWMGRVSRGTYSRPFGCLGDTNKNEFLPLVASLQANPSPKEEIESNNLPSFFLPSPDNQAALPSNKWLRVSKLPWQAVRCPLPSFPVRPRYGTWTRSYDPIGSDPFRFHRSSRFGLVLSDPTPELRMAGVFWTVEREEGASCPFSLRARAGQIEDRIEYMYMTERHIIFKNTWSDWIGCLQKEFSDRITIHSFV